MNQIGEGTTNQLCRVVTGHTTQTLIDKRNLAVVIQHHQTIAHRIDQHLMESVVSLNFFLALFQTAHESHILNRHRRLYRNTG